MTETILSNALSSAQRAWERVQLHVRALAMRSALPEHLAILHTPGSRRLRKAAMIAAGVVVTGTILCGALWWRLGSGPLAIDMVTPWLTSALEQRLGSGYHVEVGGTVLERDEEGRTAVRLRDVVVRDASGNVVASAPRAEVGVAGSSLLTGHIRAERLSLIGAEMAVRIERDGDLNVFALSATGAGSASVASAGAPASVPVVSAPGAVRPAPELDSSANPGPSLFAAAIGWLRTLDTMGLDGRDLIEVGLKSGVLAVDDQRTGRRIKFENINLSLTRLKQGGIALAVSSVGADGPWSINATVTPRGEGRRSIEAVVRDVSPKDVMLALRAGGDFQADVPLSAVVRAEIGTDGMPTMLQGRIMGGAGYIGEPGNKESRVLIDELQAELSWDDTNHRLNMPIEVHAGANRLALVAQIGPPRERGGLWEIAIPRGMVVLASLDRPREAPLILDRLSVRATLDTVKRQFLIQQADLRGAAGGLWLSGALEFAGEEARLVIGAAGTRMSAIAFKRLWPVFIAPELRSWVDRNLQGGAVERVTIATNMAVDAIRPGGPPLAEDAMSIEILSRGTSIRPVEGLPPIEDAELVTLVTGRAASVTVAAGRVRLPSGRILAVKDGKFAVADINADPPQAETQFTLVGSVEAVAEVLAMEPVRDAAALPFDVDAAHGTVSAQVALGLPLSKDISKKSVAYSVEAQIASFSADKFWRGQKAEANTLRIIATNDALLVRGDVRIAGTPAAVEYRKARGAAEADLRIQATLDEGARNRLGLGLGGGLTGPVAVKLQGRVRGVESGQGEGRLSVEADLTQARVSDMVPGWSKAPGRAARASFTLIDKGEKIRLEDFVLEGGGASVRGTIELDSDGDLVAASLPTFALSDGDKASLKADRTAEGALRLVLRGDVYDGRGLVKSAVSGEKHEARASKRAPDLDLDIRVGAMTGHHGEALRSLELRMGRRGGQIRSFTMTGKLGRDARIRGDLRTRGAGRTVMYLETNDAGALFRFTDIYPRIVGGAASVAMDPPVLDNSPRDGLLNISNFTVRGEPVLERVAAGGDGGEGSGSRASGGVTFSRLRAEFTRSPGKFSIRDGVVWGPMIGATVEGSLDYARSEVRLRGTFVPAYALNNMFSRLPILGMFLGGGENEGLLGVTYQVVGSPAAPVLQVNPMSAIAPGFLRKLFEFRGGEERTGQVPPEPIPDRAVR